MRVEIEWNSVSGVPDVKEMPVPALDECREPSVYAVTIGGVVDEFGRRYTSN